MKNEVYSSKLMLEQVRKRLSERETEINMLRWVFYRRYYLRDKNENYEKHVFLKNSAAFTRFLIRSYGKTIFRIKKRRSACQLVNYSSLMLQECYVMFNVMV